MNLLPKPKKLQYELGDYYLAIKSKGPLAHEWATKPHVLLTELIAHINYINLLGDGTISEDDDSSPSWLEAFAVRAVSNTEQENDEP